MALGSISVRVLLVDMRARLAHSEHPNRIFERTLDVARQAGLVGVRRVLDSTLLLFDDPTGRTAREGLRMAPTARAATRQRTSTPGQRQRRSRSPSAGRDEDGAPPSRRG